jgi:sugar lactone lactonase YvrE
VTDADAFSHRPRPSLARVVARLGKLAVPFAVGGLVTSCSHDRRPACEGICARPSLTRLDLLAGRPGGPGWVDGTLSAAHFAEPWALAGDGKGHLYLADRHIVRTIDLGARTVTTLAGNHRAAGARDGTGTDAAFNTPGGIAFVGKTLYVADTENHALRAVDVESAAVSTFAGSLGVPGAIDAVGEGARFREPEGLALDGRGRLFIGDTDNNTIRALATSTLAVTTVAGTPETAGTTDAVGAAARFNKPKGLAVDGSGHLYAIDGVNESVRKIDTATRAVSTLARFATLPQGLAMDGDDVLAALGDHRLVRIAPDGTVRVLAGRAGAKGFVDGPGVDARFSAPAGLWNDGAGTLYVADSGNAVIRAVSLAASTVTTFAGERSSGADDGAGSVARFAGPQGLAVDAHAVYVADTGNHTIRKIAFPSGEVTTLAGVPGVPGTADGSLTEARFHQPQGLALDGARELLFVADTQNRVIRQVDLHDGKVTTVAFERKVGEVFAGFDAPSGLAVDEEHLYASDYKNQVVVAYDRKKGKFSILAGHYGVPGRADGAGASAAFYGPVGLSLDGRGGLFVADNLNETIRKIDLATGVVSTVAGHPVTPGNSDGVGASARFHYPVGVAADGAGDVFVTDSFNDAVRRIDLSSGNVTTVAGTSDAAGVDFGPLPAQLTKPSAVALTPSGGMVLVSENAVLLAH